MTLAALTIPEAAARLVLPESVVRRMARDGRLQRVPPRRPVRVR